jgi:hypothetical protein
MMRSAFFYTNTLSWIFIVLAHWNNSPRVDMTQHSDTLFWFRADQSLLFLLNAACLTKKQQIPILLSLIWPNRGSNHSVPVDVVKFISDIRLSCVFFWVLWSPKQLEDVKCCGIWRLTVHNLINRVHRQTAFFSHCSSHQRILLYQIQNIRLVLYCLYRITW